MNYTGSKRADALITLLYKNVDLMRIKLKQEGLCTDEEVIYQWLLNVGGSFEKVPQRII